MIVTPTRGAIRDSYKTRKLMMQDVMLPGGTSQGLQVIMGPQTMTHIQEICVKGLNMTLLQERRVKGLNMTLLQEHRVKGQTMTTLQERHGMGLNVTHLQDLHNKDQANTMKSQEPHVKGHIVTLCQELYRKGPYMLTLIQGLRNRVIMTPRIERNDKVM